MTMIPIPSNDPLFQPFSKEFRNLCLDPQPLQLRLTKLQGWVILRQLQLALRHPKKQGIYSINNAGHCEEDRKHSRCNARPG